MSQRELRPHGSLSKAEQLARPRWTDRPWGRARWPRRAAVDLGFFCERDWEHRTLFFLFFKLISVEAKFALCKVNPLDVRSSVAWGTCRTWSPLSRSKALVVPRENPEPMIGHPQLCPPRRRRPRPACGRPSWPRRVAGSLALWPGPSRCVCLPPGLSAGSACPSLAPFPGRVKLRRRDRPVCVSVHRAWTPGLLPPFGPEGGGGLGQRVGWLWGDPGQRASDTGQRPRARGVAAPGVPVGDGPPSVLGGGGRCAGQGPPGLPCV